MILITSAAGQTGTRLISRLVELRVAVRGLVTNEASAERIKRLGAQAIIGNLRDPDALAVALNGAEKLYHIAPSLTVNEHEMGSTVIAAAKHAGVRHFVLHGVIAPYLQHINYHWAKQRIQFDLYRSGMPYTVILPANFMQNISWTWPSISKKGVWELPYSTEKKLTWVDLDDVAEAAANVLIEPGHEYGTYELCGTDSFISRDEIAGLMTAAFGRKIEAVRIDVEEYIANARTQPFFSRMSEGEIGQIRAMFADYNEYGMPAGNSRVLSMLLGRPAGSYRQFVEKLLAPTPTSHLVKDYGAT